MALTWWDLRRRLDEKPNAALLGAPTDGEVHEVIASRPLRPHDNANLIVAGEGAAGESQLNLLHHLLLHELRKAREHVARGLPENGGIERMLLPQEH
jgi:hypothetical protein